MKDLKEFTPLEGESVLAQIDGNAYNASPNPIIQLIMLAVKIIWLILGIKLRTYIVVTNLRIVQVDKKTLLWGILPGDTSVITLNKNSIQSVGHAMLTSWFIFRKFYFILANASGTIRITYSGDKNNLYKACDIINKLVCEKE